MHLGSPTVLMGEAVQAASVVPGLTPFREYSPAYLKIIDKKGRLVDFTLNAAQLELEEVIEGRLREGKPVRVIILKARQLGFSTYSLGRMYEFSTTDTGKTAMLVAHDDDSTKGLFEKVRLMYDMAPERPMSRYSNKTELDFSNPDRSAARVEPGLLSKIRIGTAGKLTVGRSTTLQYLHCSEVAFWDKASIVLTGLEQVLPKDAGTVEIIESTANGVGGEFHDRWKRAEDPRTCGDWIGIFFAWWKHWEYEMPLEGGELYPIPSCVGDVRAFENEERELQATYPKVTKRKLNWRRWAIVNLCGNSMDTFRQEYPSTPDEAFLTSGRPVFDQMRIRARLRAIEQHDLEHRKGPKKRLRAVGDIIRRKGRAVFQPNPDGPLRIYQWPGGVTEYVIGADIAEGVTVGKDSDESAAHILDAYSWEQVAVFQGRLPPDEFAEKLELLGYYYKKAKIAPERNNHGHTVCNLLERRRYPRIYKTQRLDRMGNKPIEKTGWETNIKTRPLMVDSLIGSFNDAIIKINDVNTLDQMLTFVRDPNTGKPQGDKDCKDDLVIALCITVAVSEWGSKPKKKASKYNWNAKHPQQAMVSRDIERKKREWRAANLIRGRNP